MTVYRADPVADLNEQFADVVQTWSMQRTVDPVAMSGILSQEALSLRRFGRLTHAPAKPANVAAAARALKRPTNEAFKAAMLDLLADALHRGIPATTLAAMAEQHAANLDAEYVR